MNYTITSYSLMFLGTALISAVAGFFAWQRRRAPGGTALFLMMLAILVWTSMDLLEASALSLPDKILWSKLNYLGAHTAPPLYLLFALAYTHRQKWVTRGLIALLFCLPVLTILFVFTNEWHHLIWTGFLPGPSGSHIILYQHGAWFWVEAVFINCVVFAGTFLMVQFAVRSKELYRNQSIALVLAAIIPWIGFAFYMLTPGPFPGLDTTGIGFAFTGAMIVFMIVRLKFLDMLPVAREQLVENMVDGLLVLDEQGRIVDLNPAAKQIFGLGGEKWIGKPVDALLPDHPDVVQRFTNPISDESELTLEKNGIIHLGLRVTPLVGPAGQITGRLIVMRDITSRKNSEKALQSANQQLELKLYEIEKLEEKLREQVIRDEITGLYNRRYLEENLDREVAQAERGKYSLCIIILDIDYFKPYNDTHGHQAGDLLLRTIGAQLRSHTRAGDIACRYGGDEFILMLPAITCETALQRIETLRQSFHGLKSDQSGLPAEFTFSAGISAYPTHGTTVEAIILTADRALYAAKAKGRNCTCIAWAAGVNKSD